MKKKVKWPLTAKLCRQRELSDCQPIWCQENSNLSRLIAMLDISNCRANLWHYFWHWNMKEPQRPTYVYILHLVRLGLMCTGCTLFQGMHSGSRHTSSKKHTQHEWRKHHGWINHYIDLMQSTNWATNRTQHFTLIWVCAASSCQGLIKTENSWLQILFLDDWRDLITMQINSTLLNLMCFSVITLFSRAFFKKIFLRNKIKNRATESKTLNRWKSL